MRALWIAFAFCASGCYLSHERAVVDAAVPVADAAAPDAAGPTDEFTFFCGSIPAGGDATARAGCCTTGRFAQGHLTGPGAVAAETLIKGSGHTVYFLGLDGRRHVFPMSDVLASWYLDPDEPTCRWYAGYVCPMVVEVPDAELATVPLGVSVTFRPGSVITGIDSSPRRYVVTRGAVLRSFRDDFVGRPWRYPCTDRLVRLLPDTFFGDYTVGPLLTDPAEYDPMHEYDTTLSDELALRAP